MSGSDEMCLRLWKARASEKLGVMKDRERVALQYAEKLKEKYAQHPQVHITARLRVGFCRGTGALMGRFLEHVLKKIGKYSHYFLI